MFVGHTDGMTHLDPKGDGRYLISNCKDQTIKLWDLRSMMEPRQYNPKLIREEELAFRWYVLMSPQDKKCKLIECLVHPSPYLAPWAIRLKKLTLAVIRLPTLPPLSLPPPLPVCLHFLVCRSLCIKACTLSVVRQYVVPL